ncbi:MAG TPA: hypothetical protein VG992_02285, partial [Candidatus Saccharimonadales bacterium]|nr:hypothetical protein [Candidatus Saccharimonadales bacterium]
KTTIVGPKVPESFNVLVKELQGLGLKVDLVHSDQVVDAEAVLATNIHEEATHPAEVEVPQTAISDVDVTEEAVSDDFDSVVDADDLADLGGEDATVTVAADDTATDAEEGEEV